MLGTACLVACGTSAAEACKQVCAKGGECAAEIARELGGKEVSAEDARAIKEQSALAQKGCELSCEQAGSGKTVRADKLAKLDECNRKPSCDDYAKCVKELGK